MAGISDFTIEKFINEIDDELKKNFIGVYFLLTKPSSF